MNTTPIGIIDSGFGGLSVYLRIKSLLPNEKYIYIGDHAHIPYSGKTADYIHKRIKKLIAFLRAKQVKMVVIACNTATVAGIDVYRRAFPEVPIIGVVPVIKTAAEVSKRKAFCVLATDFTAKSAYQKKLIAMYAAACTVYNLGGHDLVDFVELGVVDGKQVRDRIKNLVTPEIIRHIDVIALGCTHYPFLKKAIRAIVGKGVTLLDSGEAVARHVNRILVHNQAVNSRGRGSTEFITTGKNPGLSRIASTLIGKRVNIRYEKI